MKKQFIKVLFYELFVFLSILKTGKAFHHDSDKVANVPMIDNTWKYYVNANKITNEQEAYLTGIVGNDIFSIYVYAMDIIYIYLSYKFM